MNSYYSSVQSMQKTKSARLKYASGGWPSRIVTVFAGNGLDSVMVLSGVTMTSLIFSECAYGLRYVDLKNRDGGNSWSMRQTVIYHKYLATNKSSTWVMVSPSTKTETCLDQYTRTCGDLTLLNPFEIHLLVLDTLLANWRPYIVDLTARITEQVGSTLS